MKHILFLLFFKIIFIHLNAQWVKVNSPENPSQIEFVNDSVGFGNGFNSIIKTTDGGDNWQYINQTLLNIVHISFVSDQIGFAINQTRAYKTINGGISWTVIRNSLGFNDDHKLIHFVSPQEGYIVSEDIIAQELKIHRTNNQGLSWTTDSISNSISANDIYFPSRDTGFICGLSASGGMILKTHNRGASWTQSFVGIGLLRGIHFSTNNIGYVVGRASGTREVAKTLDGGNTWAIYRPGGFNPSSPNVLQQVFTASADTAYIVGNSRFLYTTNGGLNWQNQPTGFFLSEVEFINKQIGFISGSGGIFKTTNGGFSLLTSLNDSKLITTKRQKIYPNPASNKLIIDSEFKGIVEIIDSRGNLIKDRNLAAGLNTIDISNLKEGIYFVKLISDLVSTTEKIIVLR